MSKQKKFMDVKDLTNMPDCPKDFAAAHPHDYEYFRAQATSILLHFNHTHLILFCAVAIWNMHLVGVDIFLFYLPWFFIVVLGGPISDYLTRKGSHYWRFFLADLLLLFVLIPSIALVIFSIDNNVKLNNAPLLIAGLVVFSLSFHKPAKTLLRNVVYLALCLPGIALLIPDKHLCNLYISQLVLALFLGSYFHSLFEKNLKNTFYITSSSFRIREHFITELEKMIYPHQVKRLLRGDSLESTMPTHTHARCVTLVVDVQNSTLVVHEQFNQALEEAISICQESIQKKYEAVSGAAPAYKLKDSYDGFICTVGYPLVLDRESQKRGQANVALDLAYSFVSIFESVFEFYLGDAAKSIKLAVGIAEGEVEGFYPSSSPKVFDIRGESIILASRYEAHRKSLPAHYLEKKHIILVQKRAFDMLSEEHAASFQRMTIDGNEIRPVRGDSSAKEFFIRCF